MTNDPGGTFAVKCGTGKNDKLLTGSSLISVFFILECDV
jgi:hypothetical protein